MKNSLLSLVLLAGLGAGAAQAQTAPANALTNIQRRITWRTPADSLRLVARQLDELRAKKPNAYVNYWSAYAQYHLAFRAGKDRALAEKELDKGVALLEDLPNKTAEHYALLSLLQGLQLEFASFVTVPFKANTVKKNAEQALAMAPDNLRAHYARGINDYYTPKQYGGGKIAVTHFQKAIASPDKADPNPYAPDWGKADAYLYLAQAYKADGQQEQARKYAQEGFGKYPWHVKLKELAAKL